MKCSLEVPSVMLGLSSVSVCFRYTGRVRNFGYFLACRSRQASIVLEWYFRFEVSLLSFYACERDGPIRVSGGSDIIT